MKFTSDIDIDLSNRDDILSIIEHIPASLKTAEGIYRKHNTGIHPTQIPFNPLRGISAIDHVESEKRGYIKIDLLNVHVYSQIRDEQHLQELLREPNWDMLLDKNYVEKLIHLSNHYHNLQQMHEPINSIEKLAMFLALIRPAKKHMIGMPWDIISKTIWEKDSDQYFYKKSHAISYAHLVVVNMNLLSDQEVNPFS